jgi:DNA-binding NarL/FixJ family response regulator
MVRLLVADSNEAMRLGIRSVLGVGPVIDEAADYAQLTGYLRSRDYDVVLVDPMLSGSPGKSIIQRILDIEPTANILVFSTLDELTHGVATIQKGAKGYLMKSCSVKEISTAVARVSRRELYTSLELALEIVLKRNRDDPAHLHEQLSARELQVFDMQVSGLSVTDVARELKLSAKTVSTHKSRAMLKLRTRTFAEMVQYAISQGIFDDCKARCASILLKRTDNSACFSFL